ncbi:Replicative DNA helicase protein [Salinisphaera shabanensis E1L3A]|uniref:Replicative DNA helicase protein n=1 Tax=Salinisphaera shabanensis E1L3A TaxID=1033802 RepID=A0ACB4V5J9_9GAMM|nr:replicative DNA helicase [Salinisphaera shabanensis]ERJ18972.1 Replicative DNA helicase protein [Salinisphaera shabanensis E1L3A]
MAEAKLPPHSIEAEQSVIGGLLLSERAWDEVAGRINEEDFYREDHRLLFRGLADLADTGQPRDLVTLTEWLRSRGLLDKAGGASYLGNLAADIPGAANIRAYADIVRERSIMRQLIRAGDMITGMGFDTQGLTAADLLESAEKEIFAIAERGRRGGEGPQGLNSILTKAVNRIEKLVANEGSFSGLPTGLHNFDKMTNGLQPADLLILAGRPSMGKTSFAMNIVENVAIKEKVPVAVFSLEMSAEQLVIRMISSWGRIDQTRLRSGQLTEDDWPKITSAIGIMNENARLFIDDTPALSPSELRARARRLKREHDIGLVMVDYLQLMQVPGTSENRTNEISEISRSLKALAKELDVPVIALSQLNRQVEQRDNKRPRMSDLRESGGIEQDADVIMFVYRDEVYNEDTADKGVAEIIIGKQRNGPLGTARTAFLSHFTRFENLQEHYDDDFME